MPPETNRLPYMLIRIRELNVERSHERTYLLRGLINL